MIERDQDNAIFKVVVRILTENNINYWVCHGTLLGIIRDNELLPWDHDIDFAIWSDEYTKEEILKIFEKGYRFKQAIVLEEVDSLHFLTSSKRVDINFYTKDPKKAYIKWVAMPEEFLLKGYYFAVNYIVNDMSISEAIESSEGKKTQLVKLLLIVPLFFLKVAMPPFLKVKLHQNLFKKLKSVGYSFPLSLMEFKKIKFLNLDISIPYEPEKVLEHTYGEDWTIPNKNYVWYKEANNLHRQD